MARNIMGQYCWILEQQAQAQMSLPFGKKWAQNIVLQRFWKQR